MKQVECNKCGKHFEVEGEWGYCPFCENDNVEVFKNQLLNVQIVSSKEITKLHKELALTEKALELACNKIGDMFGSNYQEAWFFADVGNSIITREYFEEYFKTKAKEMMKSE